MAVKIRNRSRQLVTLELNTRDTVHLAPNEVSRALEDYEVSGSGQLDKLEKGGYVERLEEQEEGAVERAKKKSGRGPEAR